LSTDGEARIVHSDRQGRYDGNLSNRFSRDSFVGKNDNRNQMKVALDKPLVAHGVK